MIHPTPSKLPVSRSPIAEIDGKLHRLASAYRGQGDRGSELLDRWKTEASDRVWTVQDFAHALTDKELDFLAGALWTEQLDRMLLELTD